MEQVGVKISEMCCTYKSNT